MGWGSGLACHLLNDCWWAGGGWTVLDFGIIQWLPGHLFTVKGLLRACRMLGCLLCPVWPGNWVSLSQGHRHVVYMC